MKFRLNRGLSGYMIDDEPFLVEPIGESAPPAESTTLFDIDRLFDIGTRLAEGVLTIHQQRELNELNLERARRGMAPMDTQAFRAQMAPRVNVGLPPDQMHMVMWGGLALLGVLLLTRRKGA